MASLVPQSDRVVVLQSRSITALFSVIRDARTPLKEYVHHADRLLTLLAEEGLAHLPAEDVQVATPCGTYPGLRVTPTSQASAPAETLPAPHPRRDLTRAQSSRRSAR